MEILVITILTGVLGFILKKFFEQKKALKRYTVVHPLFQHFFMLIFRYIPPVRKIFLAQHNQELDEAALHYKISHTYLS